MIRLVNGKVPTYSRGIEDYECSGSVQYGNYDGFRTLTVPDMVSDQTQNRRRTWSYIIPAVDFASQVGRKRIVSSLYMSIVDGSGIYSQGMTCSTMKIYLQNTSDTNYAAGTGTLDTTGINYNYIFDVNPFDIMLAGPNFGFNNVNFTWDGVSNIKVYLEFIISVPAYAGLGFACNGNPNTGSTFAWAFGEKSTAFPNTSAPIGTGANQVRLNARPVDIGINFSC